MNNDEKLKVGVKLGVMGVVLNLFLTLIKLVAGLLSHSLSVVSDAINNGTDAAGSIVSIVGFKLSQKKADRDHPFGHGRSELIAGFVTSFFIMIFGWELLKSSIGGLFSKTQLDSGIFTIGALVVSIAVKTFMFAINRLYAKRFNSVTLKATSLDSINDVVATSVVLLAIILDKFGPAQLKNFPCDSAASVIVSLFIIKAGFDSARDSASPLLGEGVDPDFKRAVIKEVLTHSPIMAVHDFVVHDYGAAQIVISLHAEVPGDVDIFALHEVIDSAEVAVSKKFHCMTTIHMDPIDTKNPEREPLKSYIAKNAAAIDEGCTIHDLRLVTGEQNTNVIFDVVPSVNWKGGEDALREKLTKAVVDWEEKAECKALFPNRAKHKYTAVIHIDSPFF